VEFQSVRITSPVHIQITLITEEKSYSDTPFCCWALNLIRQIPHDILQLEDIINVYEINFTYNFKTSVELFSLPNTFFKSSTSDALQNFKGYSESFNNTLIKVFLIDSRVKSHENISFVIDNVSHGYFACFGENDSCPKLYKKNKIFKNHSEFISLIRRDIDKIQDSISLYYSQQNPSIKIEKSLKINERKTFADQNVLPGSNLAENNYYILNQIIGNFWMENPNTIKQNIRLTKPSERSNEIINQAIKLDKFSYLMYDKLGVKMVDVFQPILPPLILISPYHFPKQKVVYKKPTKNEKLYLKIANCEQGLDYQHYLDEDISDKISKTEYETIVKLASSRLKYLDYVGFLHAKFSYSPVIRLPLIGKSINTDLSHFENNFSSKTASTNKIYKLGMKLKELLITDELSKYLKERNGQIVVISDLPIEWLNNGELPLCFTHDVCRIPEFNKNGIVNSVIQNQRFPYQIPKDILKKTLIIHCANSDETTMNAMFNLIDNYKSEYLFNSERCNTLNEINNAIQKYKPELLIFDCHGGFDKKTLSSFLIIDGKKNVILTGEDIIKNRISAPLVFLSACSTMPNYGYVKFLSDAFIEAGAYTVTATFLPILITDAATLIVRLLGKLSQVASNPYHMNWLNLISHVLRTTLIYESIIKAKQKKLIENLDENTIAEILTESMYFPNREEAYKKLNTLIKKNATSVDFSLFDLNNEWLSYSIIGRADLIYFQNWNEHYRALNKMPSVDENNNT
jgi:hypothetical protein